MLADRLVAWPRGPAVPALAGLAAYTLDLAFGSPLIIRSLLGPNPLFGSRFYGIGNELEGTLAALLVVALGALLFGRGPLAARGRDLRRRRSRSSRSSSARAGSARTSAA